MRQRMWYSPDEWLRLIEAVEDGGGFQSEDEMGLPARCTPRTYEFVGPKKLDMKLRVLPGCENESIFEVAYDPTEPVHMELEARDRNGDTTGEIITIDHSGEVGHEGTLSSVVVCAVHDGLGWWPRYAHVMDPEED